MDAGANRDIPAYVTCSGTPATPRGINSEGLKRRGFSEAQIRNIKNAYRLVFRKGKKLAEAVEELTALVDEQPELRPFLDSLTQSERGIAR
jgi:UDP-N-acetylglucosamine acyltransferase